MAEFSHLFDEQAQRYADFRPSYNKDLYGQILSYLAPSPSRALAVDIATGNGQVAVELANHFEKVAAFDSNEHQLAAAKEHPKIVYSQGTAESIAQDDHTVDLLTCAQAAHWFDLDRFFEEAHRVLKPEGTLAIWGYALPGVKGNEKASQLIQDFRFGTDYLGPYWNARRDLVDQKYKDVCPSQALFYNIQRTEVFAHTESQLNPFMGYLSTWSAYSTYRKQHPDREDPLTAFRERFKEACNNLDDQAKFTLEWPVFLILARAKT